jgi:hypothetical protein
VGLNADVNVNVLRQQSNQRIRLHSEEYANQCVMSAIICSIAERVGAEWRSIKHLNYGIIGLLRLASARSNCEGDNDDESATVQPQDSTATLWHFVADQSGTLWLDDCPEEEGID